MRTQTSDNVKIGNISYYMELSGEAPISVYVISGEKGDMLIDTGFSPADINSGYGGTSYGEDHHRNLGIKYDRHA